MSNEKTSNVSGGGLGFCSLLAIVFITLKLCGVIGWSWWWVTAPLWLGWSIVLGFLLGITAVIFAVAGIAALVACICKPFRKS